MVGTAGSRLGSAARLSLVFALAAFFALAPLPAHAAFPGANGKIAFHRFVMDGPDVFTVDPDGTDEVDLTNQSGYDIETAWSADGQSIAFVHDAQIRMMNADGSGQTLIHTEVSLSPTWSPDGTKLAFKFFWTPPPVDENPKQADIFTINRDRTGRTNLTNDAATDDYPAWSPDGASIAFQSDRNPFGTDIYTMNPDGTGVTRLTFDGTSGSPDWSPDGNKIAYNGAGGVRVMNRDGTGQTIIAPGDHPAWSPDGKKIVFERQNEQRNSDIWVMNADGSNQTMLTELAYNPNWQPIPTASYPHPQSASQLNLSLVPAFKPCGTGGNPSNAKHAPPLATNSCNPPKPSVLAAVGVSSQSSAQMTVTPGDTDPTNGNQANVSLTASLTDIQSTAGGDYNPNPTGADLTAVTRLRITDKANGYGGLPATATEYDFKVPVDCASTPDPSVGSTCSANTTANALMPGLIQEQRQAVVQAFRVRVDDSGANGIRGDSDDRIFATQGVFVP